MHDQKRYASVGTPIQTITLFIYASNTQPLGKWLEGPANGVILLAGAIGLVGYGLQVSTMATPTNKKFYALLHAREIAKPQQQFDQIWPPMMSVRRMAETSERP